ncbi:hypothetical protein M2474_002243 [Dysgonomonas sp. PH5-37]|uniref:DUF3822 family protein n=2 Tax=unclassified Dysgonomonas TaxID=2630389 RepID=UPI0024757608|nr:DUF3822 family protein [Dysgonomonas sp. PH5-37]MDH6388796.1 hypothetical protein [Dysgonomonas sp. PH5-37]
MTLPDLNKFTNPEEYTLSVRIKNDGLDYVLHKQELGKDYFYNKIIFQKDITLAENIQKVLFENNFMTYGFGRTNVIFASVGYELVPDFLFDKNDMGKLYDLTHLEKGGFIVRHCQEVLNNALLFNADEETYHFLVRSLFNPMFHHYAGILVQKFAEKARTARSASQMYLNFHDGMIDVFCFSHFNLVHALTFSNLQATDTVYSILNIWEKSRMDQISDQLFVSGTDENFVPIINDLRKYVKNIEPLGLPSEVQFLPNNVQTMPLDLLLLSI